MQGITRSLPQVCRGGPIISVHPVTLAPRPQIYQSPGLSSDLLLVSQDLVVVNIDVIGLKLCMILKHEPHTLFTIWPPFCDPEDSTLALPAALLASGETQTCLILEMTPWLLCVGYGTVTSELSLL